MTPIRLRALAGLAVLALGVAGCGSAASDGVGAAAHGGDAVPLTLRMTSPSGQAELLLRPQGNVRGIVIFMHGLDSDQNELVTDRGLFPVRDALLAADYAIITTDAHGNNAGNPASVRDQVEAYNDAKARLPAATDVNILAFSMGGFDALLTAADRTIPPLKSVALISTAVDQRAFVDGDFGDIVTAAFDHPTPPQVPAVLKRSDPAVQPVGDYAGVRFHFWHSPADNTVPYSQSVAMSRYLTGGNIDAPVTKLTGDHGDLSALAASSVVRFFATGTD